MKPNTKTVTVDLGEYLILKQNSLAYDRLMRYCKSLPDRDTDELTLADVLEELANIAEDNRNLEGYVTDLSR